MSTILKALQRLEDEKNAGRDRSLNEQVVARRAGVAAKSRWAVIGIALLSGIAVGSAALYFWPDSGVPVADELSEAAPLVVASSATQSEPESPVPVLPANSLGAAQAARAKQRERAADLETTPPLPMVEVVRRLDEPAPAESAVAESAAAEPDVRGANRPGDRRRAARLRAEESTDSTPSEPTSPRTEAAVSARVPEPQLAAPPVVIAAVDPIETTAGMTAESVEQAAVIPDSPLRAAEPNQPPSASTSRSAPPTRDRKVIQRAEFPLISVYKTIWHPDVDRRVAIVELTESGEQLSLKQGDAVGPLVIETIRPSGVLFVHDGVEVEYRVGQ